MLILKTDQFKKDFKKLLKRYKTLDEDFNFFKKIIKKEPLGNGSKHWNILVEKDETFYVLKSRMSCRTINRGSLRVIYLFSKEENKILFIEIYSKSDKDREDSKRFDEIF